MAYLPGLLTLDHSLRRAGSRYPLVALYTDTLPPEGHDALDHCSILGVRVDYLLPRQSREYSADPRFYDTWTKLTVFGLTQFERIVLLDADMLVVKNMDELMEMELDGPGPAVDRDTAAARTRVFAACYACLCNPLKKAHYPDDWLVACCPYPTINPELPSLLLTRQNPRIPENCPYTLQHANPDQAQKQAPPRLPTMPNSGLVVLNPSAARYEEILRALQDSKTLTYIFPDQALLGDVFSDRWVPLPYIYNALKTLQWNGVHDVIWRDEEIKNIHYGLTPKPWDLEGRSEDPLVVRWQDMNEERLREGKN